MKRISELPENIKNMIAAGEVVEGPFSVVKELVENSLDAGATNITIEAEDSGLKKISVADDGSGIYKDDISLAISEHATSKIKDIKDISEILSFGFRGEALSSISSISKLTILSRNDNEQIGAKLVAENSKIEVSDYAGAKGTKVIVENLFYNTPARKKFLKSKSFENRLIRETVFKIAAASYETGFKLVLNNTKPIILKPADSLHQRLSDLYGSDFINGLYFEKVKDLKVTIQGFISKPDLVKSSSKYQQLYVNGRFIDYKRMSFHLKRAYEAIIPAGKYPVAFIYIEINPELIDINVHPAKREVKFFDSKYIDSLIYGLAKKTLSGKEHNINNPEQYIKSEKIITENESDFSSNTSKETIQGSLYKAKESGNEFSFPNTYQNNDDKINEINNYKKEEESILNPVKEGKDIYREIENDYKYIGIVFGVYILIEKSESLKIIDFHAAHERILFDKLMTKIADNDSQELVFPEEVELPVNEFEVVKEKLNVLKERGFDIDVFSDNSFIVRGQPTILQKVNLKKIISEFAESIINENDYFKDFDKVLIERIACHSAKRMNDNMTKNDIESLLDEIFSGKYDLRCPHGRPFVFNVSKNDFEKIFKR